MKKIEIHGYYSCLGSKLLQVGGMHSGPTRGMHFSFLYTFHKIKKCGRSK